MADAPKYRIGPLTTYAEAAELARDFARARPGAALTYAIGPALGKDGATLRLVRGWIAAGQASALPQVRAEGGRGFVYRISKVSSREGKGAAGNPVPSAAPDIFAPSSPEGRLLAVIEDVLGAGKRLPSYGELADLADDPRIPDGEAARYRLKKLEAAGLVKGKRV